ncbi:MAG: T9SS type A sorting domain-containing protein [Dysgonamonadaceae bacterium]|jgi:hypothetical protein|nr:T9SS type A sorting domain-containing protein [Dysgonamonadaceae bacterium]
MKKKLLFIGLLLLAVMFVKAQPYQRCLDDGIVRWSILDYHIMDAGLVSTEVYAWGDTAINDFSYKKLYIDNFLSFNAEETNTNWKNYIPVLYWEWGNFYIRENDDASKLYILDTENNEEYLISDLSLQKGDQFQIPGRWYEDTFTVVDSVYIKDNLKHVQLWWYPNSDLGRLTFIEGIGPDHWFIHPWQEYIAFLNCFQNQTLFYKQKFPDWWASDCPCGYANYSDIKTVIHQDYTFQIKNESMDIRFLLPGNRLISIYDISGRLRSEQKFSSGTNAIIPVASFPKGMYLLKITDWNKKQAGMHKFIL